MEKALLPALLVIALYLTGCGPSTYKPNKPDKPAIISPTPPLTVSIAKGHSGRPHWCEIKVTITNEHNVSVQPEIYAATLLGGSRTQKADTSTMEYAVMQPGAKQTLSFIDYNLNCRQIEVIDIFVIDQTIKAKPAVYSVSW